MIPPRMRKVTLFVALLLASQPVFAAGGGCVQLLLPANTDQWNDMLGNLIGKIGSPESDELTETDDDRVSAGGDPRQIVIGRLALINQVAFGYSDSHLARLFVSQIDKLRAFPAEYMTMRLRIPPRSDREIRWQGQATIVDTIFAQLTNELLILAMLRQAHEQPFIVLTDPSAIAALVMIRFTHTRYIAEVTSVLSYQLHFEDLRNLSSQVEKSLARIQAPLEGEWNAVFNPASLKRLKRLAVSSRYRLAWQNALQAAISAGAEFEEVERFARTLGIWRKFRRSNQGV